LDLYFTFADGALGYDCVRCGAKCCHGLGFGVGRNELVPLLKKRPHLAPFLQPAGTHAVALDLTDEGCWFLQDDGRCGIEVDEGRAQKPSVCKLFPFTRIYKIGAVTAVEPHLLMCPLEDARGQGVRWSEIASDIANAGDDLPLMTAQPPAGLPTEWADRERAVMALCAEKIDAHDPMTLVEAQTPSLIENAIALRTAWRKSLALDETEGARLDAEVARPLALLTPTLRFATLFTVGGGPYPKLERRLPLLLLAHSLTAGLAARALGRSPSLRSVGELWRGTAYVRELLSRWDRPATVQSPGKGNPLPPPANDTFDRWLTLLDGTLPLGTAFDRASADLDPPLRPLVLRALADRFGSLRF
jgi:hypothetical protein